MQTKPSNAKRQKPLRMGHVVVLGEFSPAQKTLIALQFNGIASTKAQAAAEGVGIDAIKDRWGRIADAMYPPWGQRTRQHTIAELCRRHLVEFICLILLALQAIIAINGGNYIDMRTRRGGRSRRGRYDSAMALDIDTLTEVTDWPAWFNQQQSAFTA